MPRPDANPVSPHSAEEELDRLACPECPLVMEVFVLHNLIMRSGDRLVGSLGLTSSRWLMLGVLEEYEEPPTLTELSDHVLLSLQNVSRMIAALEQDGLVERVTRRGHGRSVFVRMTDAGREACDSLHEAGRIFSDRLLDGIDPARVGELASDLRRMIRNVESFEQDLVDGGSPDLSGASRSNGERT
ncbi:MAG: MarR family transcriptional regulator [Planctomycetota bacterium]